MAQTTHNPIEERTELLCDQCGESPETIDNGSEMTTMACGCTRDNGSQVVVYPTAPEPEFPASWHMVTL